MAGEPANGFDEEDCLKLASLSVVVPFYRNPKMLERQIEKWKEYPDGISIIVVDDGSPEPAEPIITANASPDLLKRIRLFRITVDIPWNREEARNLGAMQCETEWLVHLDIDHVLPAEAATRLLGFETDDRCWYRFPRWRVGRADETRRKDKLSPDVAFGEIHPHVDSYLVTKDTYWKVGGYDLAFSGCLGGGSDFLSRLQRVSELRLLSPEIHLHVYTRSEVPDASDWSLSRDTTEGKRRARAKQANGNKLTMKPVISPWERQL